MTSGHISGRAEQGFDAHADGLMVLVLIKQDQLIEEHGPKGQELAAAEALDGHLATPLKDVFEQAIEGFDRLGAQFVKYAPDFDPTIGVRIGTVARGYQFPVVAAALGP